MTQDGVRDAAFEMAASGIRFGVGVTREVGMDLADLGARLVLVLTDPVLAGLPPVQAVIESLEASRVPFALYRDVRVEPTDESFLDAIAFARTRPFDAFVAVGGGSTLDTAKAVNLYTTYPPADFLDYVNPPIGKGLPVPGPLKPLMAIPTTAGTGSETTGVRDLRSAAACTRKPASPTVVSSRRWGISIRKTRGRCRPRSLRPRGLDILSHAVESFTAAPFTNRPHPGRPALRPAYQGSNPISDIWALEAMRIVSNYLVRAVDDPSDDEARANMLLAASYAGLGFGNAGVHLPHGMSYAVSGNVKSYRPSGLRDATSARAARHVSRIECTVGLPVHSVRESRSPSAGGPGAWRGRIACQGGGCRAHPRGPDYLVHAAAADAEWVEGDRLHDERHTRARGGHACPSTASRSCRRVPAGAEELAALFEDAMVAW